MILDLQFSFVLNSFYFLQSHGYILFKTRVYFAAQSNIAYW